MRNARVLIIAATSAAALALPVALCLPAMRAQAIKIVWMDALCGANPVNRNLHDRLNALAGTRKWESQAAAAGCEWATADLGPEALERELTRNAETIGSVIRANPRDTTLVILANSMVAARLGDLRPGVINSRLVTRDLYLFSTDPDVLCRQTSKLRVGYLRGTARRAEIVNTLAHENPRRAISDIVATEFPAPRDLADLLGASDGGLEIAALVADDVGGSYDTFKEQVLDRRPGAIRPVGRCTNTSEPGPPRLEKVLEGSVSYLTIATPAQNPAPLVALMRPGQEPGVAPQKSWFVRWTESLFPTVETADGGARLSDFKDFPVVLAVGASASDLAVDRELKQTLSHAYFEGMFDSLTAGLNPCKERSDTLFGLYLLNSYLDDRSSVEKGCALEAYYELVSTTPRRPATARKNLDILKTQPGLSTCLSRNPPPPPAPAAGTGAAALACEPSEKDFLEARDYGSHYAYYRLGLKVIAAARNQSGAAREQSLRRAETCLRRALQLQPERTCSKFSQGLFVVPYEPSLPLGAVRLKSGR